ncbi:GNAT family N-acetyltransferase [Candidatus Leptofilum sp.]|uniref:GNAT family N-acetyltransferase n=1 Tax=Candidatus Leptofilum sp. TaxID=3241576 RepID=UPI003B5C9921
MAVIRKYQPEDCEGVLAVWESATAVAHPFLSRTFLEQERLNIATLYLPNSDTWVWEVEETILGFMSLVGNEVGGLFVDPKSHRGGIGTALINVARAQQPNLEVEVFTENAIGRAFYANVGFELMYCKIEAETGFEVMRLRLTKNA